MNTFIRRAAGVAAATLLSVQAAVIAAPLASASAAPGTLDSYDRQMFQLVNQERTAAGLKPLQWYEPARAMALDHSAEMQTTRKFDHDPNFREEMAAVGCTYVGENIFYEIKGDYRFGIRTPDAAYSMFKYMNSPGHRANILRPDYTFFVAGTRYDPVAGSLYNTQRFAGSCPVTPTSSVVPGAATALRLLQTSTQSAPTTDFVLDVHGETVVAGDWDGDGISTPTVREGNTFHVPTDRKNPDGSTATEVLASYGRAGDAVYIGNWDANAGIPGADKLGVRRGNTFHLKNTIAGGDADIVVPYGREGDEVLIGDWDGSGFDTPVVRRGNTFHFKYTWTGGDADKVITYGRAGDEVFAGDWDGDGKDTLVVRRGDLFYFANEIRSGDADKVVTFGQPGDKVLVGDWTGAGADSIGVASTR